MSELDKAVFPKDMEKSFGQGGERKGKRNTKT